MTHPFDRRISWRWILNTLLSLRGKVSFVLAITIGIYLSELALPIIIQRSVDQMLSGTSTKTLAWYGVAAVLSVLVEGLLSIKRNKIIIKLGNYLDFKLSQKMFVHLMRMRTDIGVEKPGEQINRFDQSIKIRDFSLYVVPQAAFEVGNIIVSVSLIAYYDLSISLVTIAFCVLVFLMQKRRFRLMYLLAENYFVKAGIRTSALSETINSLSTVKALSLEHVRFKKWMAATHELINAVGQASANAQIFFFRYQFATKGLTLLVLLIGCVRVVAGELSVGELLAIQLLIGRIGGSVLTGSEVSRQYQDVRVAMTELNRFLQTPFEQASARPPLRAWAQGGLSVRDLSLTYVGNSRPALANVSFNLPDRGVVAVVGRNGSGKSTLMKILLGLQRDYHGDVTLAGRELRDFHPRWFRSRIGVVDQDTVLFSGTIRENVCSGVDATDQSVREALSFADALSFVEALPDGIEAKLQEGGRNLSGGQRQRLSIARAVIRNPQLVLLDEPTAFLDSEAAVALEKRLTKWGRDRLLILVSHHLAATRNADRILVLNEGRLVGDGDHESLLTDCKPYVELWNNYARSNIGSTSSTAPTDAEIDNTDVRVQSAADA
jgi:ATP-binding cassette subfamily B protein